MIRFPMIRFLTPAGLAALALAGCTTPLPPTQVVRYHLGDNVTRGTIAVQPLAQGPGGAAAGDLEFQSYAGAIQGQLARIGYVAAAPGAQPEFVALVDFHAVPDVGPPRHSPISIGLGGGGYSGGYGGGGGGEVGVGFPIGGNRGTPVLISDLSITIKRQADQSAVWEGKAHGIVAARAPDANPPQQASRLAAAMFTNFPGVSGRTIEVK